MINTIKMGSFPIEPILFLSGDRKHPLIRLAHKLKRRFPSLKSYISISLWDGYPFHIGFTFISWVVQFLEIQKLRTWHPLEITLWLHDHKFAISIDLGLYKVQLQYVPLKYTLRGWRT